MGNEEENGLPICQLEKVQNMVTNTYTKQHISPARRYHPSYIPGRETDNLEVTWWDGYIWDEALPALPREEIEVGFWLDTLCVPREKELRKKAILQMRQIYQCAHRVLVIDSSLLDLSIETDLITKYFRLYLSNYLRRLWTLQEAVMARSLIFQLKDGSITPRELEHETLEYKSVIQFYSDIIQHCSDPFDTLFDFYVIGDAHVQELTPEIAFAPFADAIQHRSTKQPLDETLCFAAILRMDVDPLLKVADDKRMEKFFEMLGTIDATIIFNNFPRLSTPGFRWAPQSIIGQAYNLFPISHERSWEVERGMGEIIEGGGLHVTFPGIDLDLASIGPHLGTKFYFTEDVTSTTWYLVRLLPDSEGNYHEWKQGAHYAIIAFEEVKKDTPLSDSIIVIVESEEGSERITVTPVARAKFEVPTQTQKVRLKAVAASHIEGSTRFAQKTKKFLRGSKIIKYGAKVIAETVKVVTEHIKLGKVSFDGIYLAEGRRLDSEQKWRVM